MKKSMPLWFRAAFAALFALLLAAYFLVRGERSGVAYVGKTSADALAGAEPMMKLESHLPRALLPPRGGYRMNGMRVQFNTLPTGNVPAQLSEIEKGLRATGYIVRRATVASEETVFGFHPETKVFISAAATVSSGVPAIRLTQRDMGELASGFVAELPGIPSAPDAEEKTLITSIDGDGPNTLNYFTQSSPEWIRDFYARTLSEKGWRQLVPPIDPSGPKMAMSFFAKGDRECSILVAADSGQHGNGVWVTVGPAAGT